MADYYPLIARAVAGLEKNTGEGRRNIYERAREALVAQLRGVTPALNESDVTRERLALEEAIRKVEGESARQAASRIDGAPKFKAPEFPRWSGPQPPAPAPPPPSPPPARERRPAAMPRQEGRLAAQAASARYVEPEDEPVADMAAEPARRREPMPWPEARMPAASARIKAEARDFEPDDDDGAPAGSPAEPPARNAGRARLASERPVSGWFNSGLRELREVISEAGQLGGARTTRSARESDAAVPESPPDSDELYLALEDLDEPVMLEPSFIVDDSRPVAPRPRQSPPSPHRLDTEAPPSRSLGDMIRIASAAAMLLGLVLLLAWQFPNMLALYRMLWTAPASDVAHEVPVPAIPAAPPAKAKIADRIEPGGAPVQQPELASVAQRVVLYEEDPTDPQGRRSVGSAVWRTEAISPGTGKSPELAVRADIEIPERKMSVSWTLRRDTDQSRSTSHTIEIVFKLPPDFSNGSIFNVPGVRMLEAELTPGTALAGVSVRVTNGYFLIGLSATTPAERDRNIQLLKERPWFEIPIVYTNNRRAILAIEKGTPGERAFAEAFAAWQQ
jgi:hypothetical protein